MLEKTLFLTNSNITSLVHRIQYGAVSNLNLQKKKETAKMEDEPDNAGEASSHSLPNNTTTRSGERTTIQKLPIPILEKNDHTSAKLWWRKFTQYTKMTREIDLSKMTNS